MKLTIKILNEKYPDFKVVRDTSMRAKWPYGITHIPTGKRTPCLIANLRLAEDIICRYNIDKNDTNYWRN